MSYPTMTKRDSCRTEMIYGYFSYVDFWQFLSSSTILKKLLGPQQLSHEED